jgi:WD40-like Beta Propeller Repeat
MRSSIAGLMFVGAVRVAVAQQAPPATDIFLAPISISAEGRPVIGKPVNVTNRPGYDNQPAFTLDSKSILFTSIHDDGQADIYRYDLGPKTVTRVTSTPESEYSATIMPGGQRFSVIRVERDSSQRLWSFAFDGSDPQLLVPTVKPVGYHAWIDPDNLALFVLGTPNALVHYDLRSGHVDTLARNIGRSLAPTIGGGGFSFTAHDSGVVKLKTMAWPYQTTTDVATLPPGSEDIVWLAHDLVLSSNGSKLVSWKTGTKEWLDAVDLAPTGLSRISRLAVSQDGKWLAIVAVPTP